MRLLRGRWWVADPDGWCAGNLTQLQALQYARDRSSLGHLGNVLFKLRRDGSIQRVIAPPPRGLPFGCEPAETVGFTTTDDEETR